MRLKTETIVIVGTIFHFQNPCESFHLKHHQMKSFYMRKKNASDV